MPHVGGLPDQRGEFLKIVPGLLALALFNLGDHRDLGVQPPVLIMLSLVGVEGYRMPVRRSGKRLTIDRDILMIPEQMTETFSPDVPQLLKPIFDVIWNAAGLKQSRNYDEDSNWKPER